VVSNSDKYEVHICFGPVDKIPGYDPGHSPSPRGAEFMVSAVNKLGVTAQYFSERDDEAVIFDFPQLLEFYRHDMGQVQTLTTNFLRLVGPTLFISLITVYIVLQ